MRAARAAALEHLDFAIADDEDAALAGARASAQGPTQGVTRSLEDPVVEWPCSARIVNRETQMPPCRHYSMLLQWDPDDEIYVVTVPELPGCMSHGATYEEAVRQGQDAIDSWVAASRAEGLSIPEPRVFASR